MKKNMKRLMALGVVLAMLLSTSALATVDWIDYGDGNVDTNDNQGWETVSEAVGAIDETLVFSVASVATIYHLDENGELAQEQVRNVTLVLSGTETLTSTLNLGNGNYMLTLDGGESGAKIEAEDDNFEGLSMIVTQGDVTMTNITLDANGEARDVQVAAGILTLAGNTTITDGATQGTSDVNRCGGGAFINSGATLVMTDYSIITGNLAGSNVMSDGGGISNKGTLIMNGNAKISGNTANRYGGGVDNWGGRVVMNGLASIDHNRVTNPSDTSGGHSASSGGLLNGGGKVTMNDSASISNNDSADRCGGVQNRGMFVMNGSSTISGNTSGGQCAGIYNYNGNGTTGTFIMNDNSSVKNNASSNQIGGVSNWSSLTMNGNAQISGNTAVNGIGGAINFEDSSIIMNGNAKISGNTGDTHTGGLYNYGNVTMNGNAQISGNTAGTNSGGVLNVAGATLTMNDNASVCKNTSTTSQAGGIYNTGAVIMNNTSSISENTAGTHAGGIYNYSTGTLTMNGSSTISNNTATRQGGGIYNNAAVVEMNGSASVTGNQAGTGVAGVANTGTFTMNAGTSITKNSTEAHTGGIYNRGTLTVNNATISGNTASYAAAINVNGASDTARAQTYLNNARIEGNTSTTEDGGDIQVKNGNVTIPNGWYDASLNDTGTGTSIQITRGVFRFDPDAYSELGAHHHDDGFYYVTDQDCVYAYETGTATCTEDGYITETCLCGYTHTTVIDATGHTAGDPVTTYQAADYGVDGYTDIDVYCTDCGALLSHEHNVIPALVYVPALAAQAEPEAEPETEIVDEETPLAEGPVKNYDEGIKVSEAIEEISAKQSKADEAKGGEEAQSEKIVELLVAAMDQVQVSEEEYITREQFAYALFNLAKDRGIDIDGRADLEIYTDNGNISEQFRAAVEWAVKMGLLNGISVDLLDPTSRLTYAQMLTILERFAALAG